MEAQARLIAAKYVAPPHTTDFAIMFLPTESLYAEVLRRQGCWTGCLRVNVAGPSNLAALLNNLQMGFRTLAIEQRSSEVWQVLRAVKTEFGKFGEALASVKKTLDNASNKIGQTEVRTRAMLRNLKSVEALPEADARLVLGGQSGQDADDPGDAGEADAAVAAEPPTRRDSEPPGRQLVAPPYSGYPHACGNPPSISGASQAWAPLNATILLPSTRPGWPRPSPMARSRPARPCARP